MDNALYTVINIAGAGWYVQDWKGDVLIGYRSKATADQVCRGYIIGLHNEAETYDTRRTAALAYLAQRAARTPTTQLEMF